MFVEFRLHFISGVVRGARTNISLDLDLALDLELDGMGWDGMEPGVYVTVEI